MYSPSIIEKAHIDAVEKWATDNIERIWAYDDYMDTPSGRWPSIYKILQIDGDYVNFVDLYKKTLAEFEVDFGAESEAHLVSYFLYPAENPPAYNSTGRHPNPDVLDESIQGSMRQAILYRYLHSDARIRPCDLRAFYLRFKFLLQHTEETGDGEGGCRGMGDYMYNHTPSMAELPQILCRQDPTSEIDDLLKEFVTGKWSIDLDVEQCGYVTTYAENGYGIQPVFYRSLLQILNHDALTPLEAHSVFKTGTAFPPSFSATFLDDVAIVDEYAGYPDAFFENGERVDKKSRDSYAAMHELYQNFLWQDLNTVDSINDLPGSIANVTEHQARIKPVGAKWFIRVAEILAKSKKKNLEEDAECLCSFLDIASLDDADSIDETLVKLRALPTNVVHAAVKHSPLMAPILANLDIHPDLVELNTFVNRKLAEGDGHVAPVTEAEVVVLLDKVPRAALKPKEVKKLIKAFESQRFNYANVERMISGYLTA